MAAGLGLQRPDGAAGRGRRWVIHGDDPVRRLWLGVGVAGSRCRGRNRALTGHDPDARIMARMNHATKTRSAPLGEEERERYARQLGLPGWGEEGQLRLRRASVLLLGCGGLGSPVALYLAAAGIGRLGLVDPDRVELSNLQRQIAHTTASLGEWKTASAAASVRALNPHVAVEERRAALTAEDEAWVRSFDAIVDATDRYATRLAHNRLAFRLGLPFVTGAVAGVAGHVAAFNPRAGGPCYECVVPADPDAGRQQRPPAVAGAAAGAIGSLMAAEILKWLAGVGEPLAGRMMHLDMAACRCGTVRLARREGCPVCRSNPTR